MMKHLRYTVRIHAAKQTVWNAMLDSKKYRQWAKAFSADSRFQGEWKQGSHIRFIDPNMGGTKAILEEVTPHDRIHAKHVAIVHQNGSEDTQSDLAKNWMGVTETYVLKNVDGMTELSVDIKTYADHVNMFNDCWPEALQLLKDICEASDGN
jgi:uncharacterized protein YndB with AHSA1/START domain